MFAVLLQSFEACSLLSHVYTYAPGDVRSVLVPWSMQKKKEEEEEEEEEEEDGTGHSR